MAKEKETEEPKENLEILRLKAEAYDLIVTQQRVQLRLQQIGQELDTIRTAQ